MIFSAILAPSAKLSAHAGRSGAGYPSLVLGLAVALFALGLTSASAQGLNGLPELAQVPDHPVVVQNSFIVQVADDVDPQGVARAVAASTGGQVGHVYSHAINGFSIEVPAGVAIAQIAAAHGGVVTVEPNLMAYAIAYPTGVTRIGADSNLVANIDGSDESVDVDIAIIDSGIDLDHPDLNVMAQCFTAYASCDDDFFHGTHVAGIAAARDNGIDAPLAGLSIDQVVGVAPGARLWAVKVLGSDGSGTIADIVAGVDFVTEYAADIEVANMSLGAIGHSSALRNAIAASVDAGVVYVVAAGNDDRDVYGPNGKIDSSDGAFRCLVRPGGKNCPDDFIPAAYTEVATVSSMADTNGVAGGGGGTTFLGNEDDTRSDFSNFSASVDSANPVTSQGKAIDLAGPGEDITSAIPGGQYGITDGTSMASPHVAGAVALFIAQNFTDAGGAVNRDYNADGNADKNDVYFVRQRLIDLGEAQADWQGGDTLDLDGQLENLVDASDLSLPDPGNFAPVVGDITSPADGATYLSGATVLFEGTASDAEDGDLTPALVWTSSIDNAGPIGLGGDFFFALSDGVHTITATVTDAGGKSASASVTVTVGNPPPPPPPPSAITISLIDYSFSGGKSGTKNMTVRVGLEADGVPVAGVTVSVDIHNIATGQHFMGSGTTGSNGTVPFKVIGSTAGCYETAVTVSDPAWDGLPGTDNGACK